MVWRVLQHKNAIIQRRELYLEEFIMNQRKFLWKLLLAISICTFSFSALGQKCSSSSPSSELDYQDRGDRCEGVFPKPVSNYDIELLSAIAYREPSNDIPQQLKLQFYLPSFNGNQEVYLKVHNLEGYYFYLMDRVQPKQGWQSGINSYEWPTNIIKKLRRGLKVNALGVLVRLGSDQPKLKEEVAPAIFYYSKLPTIVSRYMFTFKTGGDVKLQYYLIDKNGKENLTACESNGLQIGEKPFTVSCHILDGQSSFYELVAKGHFVQDNNPVRQSVRFRTIVPNK